jgi:hypothetical protein
MAESVKQRGIRVRADSIEVAMMKESLEPSVDSVSALVLEETKNQRS